MNNQPFTAGILPGRAVLRIDGSEARHFLHNLLTADIESFKHGEACYGALLTPQGKILFDLFVYDTGAAILIDCARSQMAELLKRLSFYKLRAKLTITEEANMVVGASPVKPVQEFAYKDPRTGNMGWRYFTAREPRDASAGYDAARIATGLADSDADLGSGEFFPHEANLDQLGGVSFGKGCYVGQEVVSRMEHRGSARSRILPVELDGPAPAKGSEIRSGERSIGTMLSSEGNLALAAIRIDRLAEATAPLLSEGVKVTVHKPAWVRYDVPGAKDV